MRAQSRSGSSVTWTKPGPPGMATKPVNPSRAHSSSYAAASAGSPNAGKKPARRRAPRRAVLLGRPADQHQRRRLRRGSRADLAASPFEGLARPRLAEHVDVLVEQAAALAAVDAGHDELLGPVAHAGHERQAPAAR